MKEIIEKICKTALIDYEDEKALKEILEHFERLKFFNKEIEPAFLPIKIDYKGRSDKIEKSLKREEIFKNIKNKEGCFFIAGKTM